MGVDRAILYDVSQNDTLLTYHWQELPQVSFFVAICRDKSMLAATKHLSRQNYVCRDKIILSRQIQTRVCHDKRFVATKDVFCRDKSKLVATNVL